MNAQDWLVVALATLGAVLGGWATKVWLSSRPVAPPVVPPIQVTPKDLEPVERKAREEELKARQTHDVVVTELLQEQSSSPLPTEPDDVVERLKAIGREVR